MQRSTIPNLKGRVPRATFHAETFEEIDETDLVWVIAARAA